MVAKEQLWLVFVGTVRHEVLNECQHLYSMIGKGMLGSFKIVFNCGCTCTDLSCC